MINPFGGMPGGNPLRAAEIKQWTRQALALPDEVTVMVTELRCSEAGCPPLETCIAVLRPGSAPQQHRLFKGMTELTYEDVAGLAPSETPHGGSAACSHPH